MSTKLDIMSTAEFVASSMCEEAYYCGEGEAKIDFILPVVFHLFNHVRSDIPKVIGFNEQEKVQIYKYPKDPDNFYLIKTDELTCKIPRKTMLFYFQIIR